MNKKKNQENELFIAIQEAEIRYLKKQRLIKNKQIAKLKKQLANESEL